MKQGSVLGSYLTFCQCDDPAVTELRILGKLTLCPNCCRPSAEWFYSQDYDMLNYFRGGPYDGKIYETQSLMRSVIDPNRVKIELYRWTPSTVTSQLTGAIARVWVFKNSGTVDPQCKSPNNTQEESVMTQESTSLLERRKSLKLSRAQVSEHSGLSQAKIARIEAGGKRTTDEEREALSAALDALTPKTAEESSDPS